jgi:hypothetical protein
MDLIDRQALLRKLFPYEVFDLKSCAINAYAVKKAILDAPVIHKPICQKCIHYAVCYPRIQGDPKHFEKLSYCEFYKKGDDNG